jgi:aspartate ammonia-lyase
MLFLQAFADAYSFLEKMLMEFSKGINDLKLLPSILSSSDSSMELIVEKVQHGI